MYWFFTLMVAVAIFMRWKLLPPSLIFEKEADTWVRALSQGWRQYRESMRLFLGKAGARIFLGSKFIDEWTGSMWGVYSSLYIVGYLGMRESYLPMLSLVAVYVAFLALFIVIPNLNEKKVIRLLGYDQIFWVASFGALFLAIPCKLNILPFILVSTGLGAVAGAFSGSINASVWMNIMEEKERAKVVAASSSLTKLGYSSSGFLGAFLYGHVSPVALLGLLGLLRALNFFMLRKVSATLSPVLDQTNS